MTKFDLPNGSGALVKVPDTVAEIRRWKRAAVKKFRSNAELRNYVISVAAELEAAHAKGEECIHVL